jgi:O-antigen/teichoic acid export membrane protein
MKASTEKQGAAFPGLIRHTLIYGSGYVTMALVSAVLVPVYTHHLTPSAFGLLALMLVLYGFMKQVYDLGFTNSVARFFFDCSGDRADEDLRRMRSTSMMFLVLFGGVLTATLWIFAGDWAHILTGDASHADLVRIVALTLYAETLAIVPLTLIRMQERSTLYVSMTVVRFVIALVLSIIFVAGLSWGVRGALLANAISAGAVLVLLFPEIWLALTRRPSAPLLRQMLSFGLPFFPVLLSGWFIDASDRYLLELFRTTAEVGYYSLAYRVAMIMWLGVAAFSMGWAPLRYKIYERPDAPDVYRRLTTYYVIAASLLGVALSVFARDIVSLVAPASYASAAGVVPILALAYALWGLYLIMVTGMGVTKKTAPMAWIAGAAAAFNVGVNLLVIPRWGMLAAAVTTAIANALMVAGGWLYSQKVYPIPYDWRRIGQVGVIAAAIVCPVVLISPPGLIGELAWAAAAWAAFLAALVKTGVITRHDLQAARQWARQAFRVRRRREVVR